jgi:hypothetical protein
VKYLRVWHYECNPRVRGTPRQLRLFSDPVSRVADAFGWDRMKAFGHLVAIKSQVVRHREDGVLDGVSPMTIAEWFQLPQAGEARVLEVLLNAGILCCPERDRAAHRYCPLTVGRSRRKGGAPRPAQLAVHGWEDAQGEAVRESRSKRRSGRLSSALEKRRRGDQDSAPSSHPLLRDPSGSKSTAGGGTKLPESQKGGPVPPAVPPSAFGQPRTEPVSAHPAERGPPSGAIPRNLEGGTEAVESRLGGSAEGGTSNRAVPGTSPKGGPHTSSRAVAVVSDVAVASDVSSESVPPAVGVEALASTAGCPAAEEAPATAATPFPPCILCDETGRVYRARRSCFCPRGRDRARRMARSYAEDRAQAARAARRRPNPLEDPAGGPRPIGEVLEGVLRGLAGRGQSTEAPPPVVPPPPPPPAAGEKGAA